ncbi:NAD(P)H-hydrate dehydratase [Novilysobacter selenitireducens]|uniref:Bifunctional NAD(P)H-hydrate repair enzyme n=1 Tax=Novilysobacter selenitireducens TaxID=2872639 RepID=A0ABS7T7H4_9GAMM|nr:NAD(P)H-hydrate dehydratase [Lysobacter selenitireducens]MBZ4039830.1 NAD(P)H-hydrate dehydratase [Lysobacter selenitireducens]
MAAARFDVQALRAIEARATRRLGDGFELMQRAGQAAWREVLHRWPHAQRLTVVCGPGNNGGDGYVLARLAHESGRDVRVVRAAAHEATGTLAQRAEAGYRDAGGSVVVFDGELDCVAGGGHIVVDAVLGIGLSRAPDAVVTALVEAINGCRCPVLALDVPTGVDADTGTTPGAAVHANACIEFIAPKAGLRTGVALDCTGTLSLAALGVEADDFAGVEPVAVALRAPDLHAAWPPRLRDSHKGRHGRVACIGGDSGHGGAILMTAEAALRTGAGLVDVVTRPGHVSALLARRPEVMAHGADAVTDDARSVVDHANVVAIGPGLGQGDWGRAWFDTALASGRRLVVDADALHLLAQRAGPAPADAILTPHPGEAAALLGCGTSDIQSDRLRAARRVAERYQCAVVLKGAGTVVGAPGRVPRLVEAGNPGMAVGGMGDVLTGVIASLCAQGLAPFDAACTGALLHALAGDRAVDEGGPRGLLPSDLMPWLRRLANDGDVAWN